MYIKQLLDEVEHDIMNYQNRAAEHNDAKDRKRKCCLFT